MTIQKITTTPSEKGTAKVTVSPTDENGTALAFGDLTDPQWQLMRKDESGGAVIVNSRTFALSSLTSLVWSLSGDDLAMFGTNDTGWRRLAFQATYDSALGLGLLTKAECTFEICKLLSVVDS